MLICIYSQCRRLVIQSSLLLDRPVLSVVVQKSRQTFRVFPHLLVSIDMLLTACYIPKTINHKAV